MKCLPCRSATSAVVPLPMKGSSTRPGFQPAPQPQSVDPSNSLRLRTVLSPLKFRVFQYVPDVAPMECCFAFVFQIGKRGVPQALHTAPGHPARMGVSMSADGKTAKWASRNGREGIVQTERLFLPAEPPATKARCVGTAEWFSEPHLPEYSFRPLRIRAWSKALLANGSCCV